MKKLWVGTSWKMNKDAAQADAWASAVKPALSTCTRHIQPFVIPPFPYVSQVNKTFAESQMRIGMQNICWQDEGAFTGEISPLMAKDCGASIVEIGHSERRAMFGETDKTVNLKVHAALRHGLTPLVCVGDSLEEKRWNVSVESVVRQVKIALFSVPYEQLHEVIIAYEPVWAIGEQGVPATSQEAETMHAAIRHAIAEQFDVHAAEKMFILYGGSVNLSNAPKLLAQKNIDGVFVGRTAWDAKQYIELLTIAQRQSGANEWSK